MIAHDPLHGSGRAALPHPALALGDNAEAHEGIGMANVGGWQPPVDVASHPPPRQMMALAAALEGPPPKPTDGRAKGANTAPVHGHAVVPHVPGYDRAQISSYRRERLVQTSPEFGLDRLELRLPSLAHRLPQHREPSLSRPPAAMREAEKVEGLRFPVATPSPGPLRVAAELDEPRLVGVQRQPELREPLAQLGEEPLGLLPLLEPHDEVIRKAHDHDIAARLLLPPPLGPVIEHVVQVDIGQQRADAPALHRPHLTPRPLALLQHAGVQPLLDEPHDAPVRHAMLDKLHQPPVVEGVEEPTDVRIEHPVHLLHRDPDCQRIQRLMRTAPRPEPVREPEKVDLVDRVQDRDDRALDEFVLQRGNAERPEPPVGLRDERSPDRLRPVRPSLEPSREILEIRFQALAVVPPRLAVDARCRVSLQRVVRGAQPLDVVHVVQERREPLLPVPLGCLTHPLERARRAYPARCPERVTLGRVPLGPLPSLRRPAAGSSALFGGFPGTTERSDCPRSSIIGVYPWTSRCGLWLPQPQTNAGSPGSRSRCLGACSGSLTARGPSAPRDIGAAGVAFRLPPERRHPEVVHGFRGSIPGPPLPLSTLRGRPHGRPRMTRGRRGSLRLRRMTLSFTAPRRFDRRTEDDMRRPASAPGLALAAVLAAGCAVAPPAPPAPVAATTPAAALPELIALSHFFASREATWGYRVSPDGTRLGWIASHGGRHTVHVRTLGADDARPIDTRSPRTIYWFTWARDSRHVLYVQDQNGDENHHVYLASIERPNDPPVDLTPAPGTRAWLDRVISSDPDHLVIAWNKRGRAVFDLYRVNLTTREHALIAENPGDVTDWLTDWAGRARARIRHVGPAERHLEVLRDGGWAVLQRLDLEEFNLQMLGLTPDDRGLWLLSSRGRDRLSLVRVDVASGSESLATSTRT